MLKADFHIHSKYSMDCAMSPEAIVRRCQEVGLNCITIADHGTVEGGLALQKIAPFTVIVAEEILTPHGEIMGMFLKETIPSGNGISPAEAIARIREQDGLVCIPHPYDTVRMSALGGRALEDIVGQIDILEVFNARCLFPYSSERALALAKKHNVAQSAGSDSHTLPEIGNVCVEMPEFTGKADFLEALRLGKITGHRSSPLVHFNSVWNRLQTKLGNNEQPEE
ncbi:MAG: PHP domain-containing protein [Dehalococcoidales bacterium]|nr:PHP domain-containing protein [Dehalococcoidales bacterium]